MQILNLDLAMPKHVGRRPLGVMTASLSRNFEGPLRLRLPKQLLRLRRNEGLVAPTSNVSRRERPVADHSVREDRVRS